MKQAIDIETVHTYIVENFDGVVPVEAYSETAYFYNPGNLLKRGTYFATIKQTDGENDKASNIDREGVWRLNMGVRKKTFLRRYDKRPARPTKGGVIRGPWHFETLDLIMPHPVYGWMNWIAVLNPGAETFEMCKPLLADAYQRAVDGFNKRTKVSLGGAEEGG